MIRIISAKNIPLQKTIDTNSRKNIISIINDIQKRGDIAVRKYEKKFSNVNTKSFKITSREIKSAYENISSDQLRAVRHAKKTLENTERQTMRALNNIEISNKGVRIKRSFKPISSVGCYVPGGLALYPSSLIMGVVPAKVAGVKRIIVSTPTDKTGRIDPLVLVAADICKVDEIYKVGGAQAIAAMSIGTKSIPKVDKIIGPGGKYVSMAKIESSSITSIDMYAGPTELGIIADSTSDPKLVAVDLISQAEHSKDTCCFLLTTSEKLAKKVQSIIKNIKTLRSDIVQASLKNNGFIICCKNDKEMINLANELAPEHLEILTKSPDRFAKLIVTPGLVLVGRDTPSSASDYLLGSNHILPTNQFGKTRGSLSVLDFLKLHTVVKSTRPALKNIYKDIKVLTTKEGLPNHLEAVRLRL